MCGVFVGVNTGIHWNQHLTDLLHKAKQVQKQYNRKADPNNHRIYVAQVQAFIQAFHTAT